MIVKWYHLCVKGKKLWLIKYSDAFFNKVTWNSKMLLWPLYSMAIIIPQAVKRNKISYETNENNMEGGKELSAIQVVL